MTRLKQSPASAETPLRLLERDVRIRAAPLPDEPDLEWLRQEVAEAAKLAEQLAAEGLSVNFDVGDGRSGLAVSVRDQRGGTVMALTPREVVELDHLRALVQRRS